MEVSPSMRDPQVAVIVLLNCTKFMDTPDLIRASQVSHLWYSVLSRKINWRTIKIKSCSTSNMKQLARVAKKKGSRTLDMRGIYEIERTSKDYWYKLFCEIQTVDSLTELKLGKCDPDVITLFQKVSWRNRFNSLTMEMVRGYCKVSSDIINISLNSLVNLKKLSLNVYTTYCIGDTEKVLDAVAEHENLTELELNNFFVTEMFPSQLSKCTRLKKFSITPILSPIPYLRVIEGVTTLKNTLTSFKLGVFPDHLMPSQIIDLSSSRGCRVTRADSKATTKPSANARRKCRCPISSYYFVIRFPKHHVIDIRNDISNLLPDMETEIVLL